jgi:glycosyltransferase involved in cell wall biosynthesis
LFEYLSLKKPVISTRLDETKNIDEGFLFYADTADELEQAILHILSHQDTVCRYTEKGYGIIRSKYAWDVIVENLLGMLAERQKVTQAGGEHAVPVH